MGRAYPESRIRLLEKARLCRNTVSHHLQKMQKHGGNAYENHKAAAASRF